MTLSNVSDSSIDKALFAKIALKKLVSLTAHSGNIRVVSLTDFIETIEFKPNQGYTVAKVNSYSALATNGQWFWDRDNALLYVYCSASLPYKIIVIINIFVTTAFDVLGPADPDDLNNADKTIWCNRLQETSFSQSCEDQLDGKIGISTTNIMLINNDSYYNYLATDSVSFKNAVIKVWVVINDFSNRELIFRGVCENASFGSKDISLSVIEYTKVLQKEATFGDSATWSTANKAKWSDVKQEDEGKIIPFIFGNSTGYKSIDTKGKYETATDIDSERPDFTYPDVDPNNDIKPIFLKNRTTGSKGKQYAIGRTDKYSTMVFYPKTTAWGSRKILNTVAITQANFTATKKLDSGGSTYYAEFKIAAIGNLFIDCYVGQYLRLVSTDVIDVYTYERDLIVTEFNSSENYIKVRYKNWICWPATLGHEPSVGTFTSFNLVYWTPTVYTVKGNTPVVLSDYNYEIESEDTDGGNKIWYLILKSDYNVNSSFNYNYLDGVQIRNFDLFLVVGDNPDIDYPERLPDLDLYVRAYVTTKGIAQVLNYAANKCSGLLSDSSGENLVVAGGDEDLTSFHRFNYELDINNYYPAISPTYGSNKFDTYLDIFEKCLSSSFSFCCLSRDNKFILRLFNNSPYGSQILELTEDDIKDGSVGSDISFSEICSKIYGQSTLTMDGNSISYNADTEMLSGEISRTFESRTSAKYFYDLNVKSRIESYWHYPIKKYMFKIINKGYELTLGDRISIRLDNSGKWLGSDTVKNLFVTKINKSLSGVEITAIENNFIAPKV